MKRKLASKKWSKLADFQIHLGRFNSLASISCTSRKDNVAPTLEKTKSIALRAKAIGFLSF